MTFLGDFSSLVTELRAVSVFGANLCLLLTFRLTKLGILFCALLQAFTLSYFTFGKQNDRQEYRCLQLWLFFMVELLISIRFGISSQYHLRQLFCDRFLDKYSTEKISHTLWQKKHRYRSFKCWLHLDEWPIC